MIIVLCQYEDHRYLHYFALLETDRNICQVVRLCHNMWTAFFEKTTNFVCKRENFYSDFICNFFNRQKEMFLSCYHYEYNS